MDDRKGKVISVNDKEGICPVCGTEFAYTGTFDIDDDGLAYSWECPNCGASGKEGFNLQFDRHYNVQDENGNSIPGRPEDVLAQVDSDLVRDESRKVMEVGMNIEDIVSEGEKAEVKPESIDEKSFRICPLMGGKPCVEGRCAWWIPEEKISAPGVGSLKTEPDCAVKNLSRTLDAAYLDGFG